MPPGTTKFPCVTVMWPEAYFVVRSFQLGPGSKNVPVKGFGLICLLLFMCLNLSLVCEVSYAPYLHSYDLIGGCGGWGSEED